MQKHLKTTLNNISKIL